MQRFKDLVSQNESSVLKFIILSIVIVIPSALNLFKFEKQLIRNENPCDNFTIHQEEEPIRLIFWYENVPMPPIAVANSRTIPAGDCGRQLQMYLEELKNGTLWATQMFDASVKYPHGILDGYTRHFGSFDQCYRINAILRQNYGKYTGVEYLKGKYCLVDFKYEKNNAPNFLDNNLDLEFDPNISVWESIREKGDFRRIRRYLVQMGLCVPATCSYEDVKDALQGPYEDFGNNNDLTVTVRVDKKNCQTRDESPRFTRGAILYSLVLCTIIILVIFGTYNDESLTIKHPKSLGDEILLCFSIQRNIETISQVNYCHRGLDTIHMFRFLATSMVIFGHRGLQYFYNPIVNAHSFEKTFDIPGFIMFYNGPILVDGFFGIGGLLASYTLLDHLERIKSVNFISLILLRFMRLTPVYAFVVFFIAYLMPHLGSGPQWPGIILAEAENCAATWWANLLYINNYVAMNRICMFQSWYLAVDFQSYVLTIFLVYEFWKRPRRVGYAILIFPTVVSVLIPFFLTYVRRIQPLLIPFPFLTNLEMDPYFCNYYVKTHLRVSAYFIGVIFGAVLFDYRKESWRISKKYSKGLFFLSVVIMCYGAQGLGYKYLNPNSKTSLLYSAIYASLHRGAYAVGICSIVLLITICDGLDSHHEFMTKRWAQPLARLTYSAFLCHTLIQSYQMGSNQSSRTFSTIDVLWNIIPDIFFSFALAFVIVILVEAPFRKMEKIFIVRGSKIFCNQNQNEEST